MRRDAARQRRDARTAGAARRPSTATAAARTLPRSAARAPAPAAAGASRRRAATPTSPSPAPPPSSCRPAGSSRVVAAMKTSNSDVRSGGTDRKHERGAAHEGGGGAAAAAGEDAERNARRSVATVSARHGQRRGVGRRAADQLRDRAVVEKRVAELEAERVGRPTSIHCSDRAAIEVEPRARSRDLAGRRERTELRGDVARRRRASTSEADETATTSSSACARRRTRNLAMRLRRRYAPPRTRLRAPARRRAAGSAGHGQYFLKPSISERCMFRRQQDYVPSPARLKYPTQSLKSPPAARASGVNFLPVNHFAAWAEAPG